jgi:hypothetical protein
MPAEFQELRHPAEPVVGPDDTKTALAPVSQTTDYYASRGDSDSEEITDSASAKVSAIEITAELDPAADNSINQEDTQAHQVGRSVGASAIENAAQIAEQDTPRGGSPLSPEVVASDTASTQEATHATNNDKNTPDTVLQEQVLPENTDEPIAAADDLAEQNSELPYTATVKEDGADDSTVATTDSPGVLLDESPAAQDNSNLPDDEPLPAEQQTEESTPETAQHEIALAQEKLSSVWGHVEEVQSSPELVALVDRTTVMEGREPSELLATHRYPERSTVAALDLGEPIEPLNEKFVKDGHMYVLRGDHPGQQTQGFYSRTYGYGKKNTAELSKEIGSPTATGYILYGDERYLQYPQPHANSVSGELAFLQSARGGSSFVSTTTSLSSARPGTGNQPSEAEKASTEIYIARVPVAAIVRSPTGNHFGLDEYEYLVPDYIGAEEVVAHFPRNDTEAIYDYLRQQLGISREDID